MAHLAAAIVIALSSSASIGVSPAFAQEATTLPAREPVAAYQRAEALLPQHIAGLITGMSVHPHWIGETSRFWFEKVTRAGREHVLVDAAAGTMRPLFDAEALIAALAAATGQPIARKAFQLPTLRVDAKSGLLRFRHGDRSWQYDAATRGLSADAETPNGHDGTSPDGAWRAIVRHGNLFVISTKDGSEKQLTTDGSDEAPYATPVIDPKIMIAQGTQHPLVPADVSWSPDSKRIATYRLDLEGARRLAFVQSTPPDDAQPRTYQYVYSLPGDAKVPMATGLLFDVAMAKRTDMALAPDPVLYYFGPSYTWSADSKAVFARLVERGDRKMELFRIEAETGAAKLLSADRSNTYLDTWTQYWGYEPKADMVYLTADTTGSFQLYGIDPHSGARRQLTSGDGVVRGVVGIDKAAGHVLIMATGREAGQNPYLQHLYAMPRNGGALKALTPEPLDHDTSLSPDGRYFVDNMSLVDRPTRSVLRRAADGKIVMELGHADIGAFLAAGHKLPEPFEALAADGRTRLYGAIFKPADFDPTRRYPIVEEIYAGPQMISNSPKSFEAAFRARFIAPMAELGAIGVTIDGRGTAGRGRAFQQPAYRNVHAVGLDDHIAGIRAAAATRPWMDTSRVGLYGYSAGGFDVVRAMTERPDFYKVGLTGAGVQDNRLDKAWWNEQWMGLDDHKGVYEANSNITWAPKLEGKLMIVHGELDDNVPPANSLRLVDALMKANKDFELVIVPNANHPIMAVPYFWRKQWDFFVRELLGKTPPAYRMKPYP